ncbi:hypothetical protein ACFT8W_41545 [Streptomyces hygroscopicus]|uniref:hypothetical protein n=1 Tax=Streptomyces hygroscopicus TaxID=1912 RepID=UPI00362DBBA6
MLRTVPHTLLASALLPLAPAVPTAASAPRGARAGEDTAPAGRGNGAVGRPWTRMRLARDTGQRPAYAGPSPRSGPAATLLSAVRTTTVER